MYSLSIIESKTNKTIPSQTFYTRSIAFALNLAPS